MHSMLSPSVHLPQAITPRSLPHTWPPKIFLAATPQHTPTPSAPLRDDAQKKTPFTPEQAVTSNRSPAWRRMAKAAASTIKSWGKGWSLSAQTPITWLVALLAAPSPAPERDDPDATAERLRSAVEYTPPPYNLVSCTGHPAPSIAC